MARKSNKLALQEKRLLENHVKALVRTGVQYVSGTISPSKGNKLTKCPESIGHAFSHYERRGYTHVCVQIKDMGSRANVYLRPKLEDCFVTTRNGYKLRDIREYPDHCQALDIQALVKDEWEKHMRGTNFSLVLLDCELMPWNALADTLIEREYGVISTAIQNETDALRAKGFESAIEATTNPNAQTAKHIGKVQCIDSREEDNAKLRHQVNLFVDNESAPYLKPFNILKTIDLDGVENVTVDNFKENYDIVGVERQVVVDVREWELSKELAELRKEVEVRELEGVMIKPVKYIKENGAAPMLKVRNEEYLRITYGYNYRNDDNIEALIAKKDIAGKIQASVTQYNLGRTMLTIPATGCVKGNVGYVDLCSTMVKSIRRSEAELDPRL